MASPGSAAARGGALLLLLTAALALPAGARADAGDPAKPTDQVTWLAAVVAPTAVHTQPAESSKIQQRLKATTPWGGPMQLMVRESQRTAGELWLDVRLMGRPNGNHGWIRADHATLSKTAWRIEVSRGSKTLRLFKGGKVKKTIKVVVGAAGTPTPSGAFALADKLQLRPATGFLGNWALPITAYSNVLTDFDGGSGQVALHGRAGASLSDPLGTARSHGCVRIKNSDISRIAAQVPTGAPVNIS